MNNEDFQKSVLEELNANRDFQKSVLEELSANRDFQKSVLEELNRLNTKVDTNFQILNSKVDTNFQILNSKIDANFHTLNCKIESVAEVVLKTQDDVSNIKKDLTLVQTVTASNYTDIIKLKAVR